MPSLGGEEEGVHHDGVNAAGGGAVYESGFAPSLEETTVAAVGEEEEEEEGVVGSVYPPPPELPALSEHYSPTVAGKADAKKPVAKKKRICKFPGCTKTVKAQGHCQRHGAKTKRCKVPDCTSQAQGSHDGKY